MKGRKSAKRLARRVADFKAIPGMGGSRPNSTHTSDGREFHLPGSNKK